MAQAFIWQWLRREQAGTRQLRSETKKGWKGKLAFLWWEQHTRHKRVCLPWKRNWQEATTPNVLRRAAVKGEQNQSLCLSWPCLPTGPYHCARHHTGKSSLCCIQQAPTLMCKCMQENFQKSQNYCAKWGSCTQIVRIMNNYRVFHGSFLNFL